MHELVFVQQKDTIPIVNNIVQLKKKTFSINMQLHDLDLVLVNMALTNIVQDSLRSGVPADSLYCFRPIAGMSYYNKNGGLQLMVLADDHSYWGINEAYNSFDFDAYAAINDSVWLVKRTVENITVFDQDRHSISYSIKAYPGDDLYLVYYFYHQLTTGERIIIGENWLQIKFVE